MVYAIINRVLSPRECLANSLFFLTLAVAVNCSLPFLLDALAFVHLLDDGVHGDEKDDVDDRVEQANGAGEAIVTVNETFLVHVGGDDLRGAHIQVGLEGIGFLKADAHDVAYGHDKLDEHRVLDSGPLHRLDLLDDIGSVQDGRLLQIFAGVGQGRSVDDGGPAGALPDAAGDVDGAERLGHGHEVIGRTQEMIDHACGGEKDAHDTAQHDDRDEVGHIQHQLYLLLSALADDAVEQEGQQDGGRKTPQEAKYTQLQGVGEVLQEVRGRQEAFKVGPPCKSMKRSTS